MDFTSLQTDLGFLVLRREKSKKPLAYIDGRGPEPHCFIPVEIVNLIALPDDTRVSIVDWAGNNYDEGIRPPEITLNHVRKELRRQDLTFYETYSDYCSMMREFKTEPLHLSSR